MFWSASGSLAVTYSSWIRSGSVEIESVSERAKKSIEKNPRRTYRLPSKGSLVVVVRGASRSKVQPKLLLSWEVA